LEKFIPKDPVSFKFAQKEKNMKAFRNIFQPLSALFIFLFLSSCLPSLGICSERQLLYGTENKEVTVNFDKSLDLPFGFKVETTGYAKHDAVWKVVKDPKAPSSPNILKITEIPSPSGYQFNLCWSDRIRFRDGEIEVKVRADSGEMDQGGGPIWRVKDRMNYYVARLNPLEDNFRIYYVKNGRRVMIATSSVKGIKVGQWFTIKIITKDNTISGWVNGKKMMEVKDATFGDEGGVGMWTKADAASSFDDLLVRIKE